MYISKFGIKVGWKPSQKHSLAFSIAIDGLIMLSFTTDIYEMTSNAGVAKDLAIYLRGKA
jgi:hypothetical protein